MSDKITCAADLAAILKAARRSAGRRQQEAAGQAGVSRQRLSEIEGGKASNLQLATLLRLLASYNLVLKVEEAGPRPNLNDILHARDEGREYF